MTTPADILADALHESMVLNGDIPKDCPLMNVPDRRHEIRRSDDRDVRDELTANALRDREMLLMRKELHDLEASIKALTDERNNALRWGIIMLGTAVLALISFIVITLKGAGHS